MEAQEIRRTILQRLIDDAGEAGLAKVSKLTGKPDRQLNDMLAGRKSFGEKVAKSMEIHAKLPEGYFSNPNNLPGKSENGASNTKDKDTLGGLSVNEDPTAYINELLKLATPRGAKVLTELSDIAKSGKLQESDIQIIEAICSRYRKKGPS